MTLLIDLVDQVQELGAGDAIEFQALAARLRGLAEPAFGADAPIDALRADLQGAGARPRDAGWALDMAA